MCHVYMIQIQEHFKTFHTYYHIAGRKVTTIYTLLQAVYKVWTLPTYGILICHTYCNDLLLSVSPNNLLITYNQECWPIHLWIIRPNTVLKQ